MSTKYTKEQIISEHLKGPSLRYSRSKNKDINEFIENSTNLQISYKEKVYCYINDIIPSCKNPSCKSNKIPQFQNFKTGYKNYCSVSCSVKASKESQEESRKNKIQEKLKDMSIHEIVYKLYHKEMAIQKWRDIEKLKEYYDFKTLKQVYLHVVLKENQICDYCKKPFDIDAKTGKSRKCTCTTSWDREALKLKKLNKEDFLETMIKYNLHHYSGTKNKMIENIYREKFEFKHENFMKQINEDCLELNIDFYGYYNNISKAEKEVYDFIKTFYNGEILENDRSFGVEFDMYIPELKIAIEYNGLYWHSARFKDKRFHLNKTEIAEKNNIQLIHIFENEWINKKEIVKSILKAKLGFSGKRIFARKCLIKEVPSKISNKFLEDNHIQGKDNSPFRYGLYYNDELVQIFTLKRSHRSKDKYLELKRSASKIGHNIIGGFGKLLKHAKRIHNEDIVTFADRRFSSKDNVYKKFGKFVQKTNFNHFWINGLELKSREAYQKHKLKDILEHFDDSKTAIENCHDNDIWEIYDCGNFKYIL
jgi:hypothetical protein